MASTQVYITGDGMVPLDSTKVAGNWQTPSLKAQQCGPLTLAAGDGWTVYSLWHDGRETGPLFSQEGVNYQSCCQYTRIRSLRYQQGAWMSDSSSTGPMEWVVHAVRQPAVGPASLPSIGWWRGWGCANQRVWYTLAIARISAALVVPRVMSKRHVEPEGWERLSVAWYQLCSVGRILHKFLTLY